MATSDFNPPPGLPRAWVATLAGRRWTALTIGRSGAGIWRVEAEGQPAEVIKAAPGLSGEAARLRWLHGRGIPCAEVTGFVHDGGIDWMRSLALPGRNLVEGGVPPEEAVRLAAGALTRLHRLDPAGCPFDTRLATRLAAAKVRLGAGLVDPQDFPEAPPAEVLGRMVRDFPPEGPLVVTHGDTSLPNFMAEAGRFTGFVDCGKLGLADPWQDLALTAWSVAYNFGEAHVPTFLTACHVPPDPARRRLYKLLDAFF